MAKVTSAEFMTTPETETLPLVDVESALRGTSSYADEAETKVLHVPQPCSWFICCVRSRVSQGAHAAAPCASAPGSATEVIVRPVASFLGNALSANFTPPRFRGCGSNQVAASNGFEAITSPPRDDVGWNRSLRELFFGEATLGRDSESMIDNSIAVLRR